MTEHVASASRVTASGTRTVPLTTSVMRAWCTALLVLGLAAPLGCKGKRTTPSESAIAPSGRAVISLESVEARSSASGKAPVATLLRRGANINVLGSEGDFWRVSVPSGGEAWIPSGSFERLSERSARESRGAKVRAFPRQLGRAVEPAPILLAPEFGAARWGELEDGDDVEVLLADHDFYGVMLPDSSLAFVPARSIRLLASPNASPEPENRVSRHQPVPRVTSLGPPGGAASPDAPTGSAASARPFETLPPGGDPPELETRVEPRYPEIARRNGIGGDVVLKVVVEANGSVGRIDVVTGAPGGLTESAIDAVRRWKYRPARVAGRPIAVYKTIGVKFTTGRDRPR